MQLILLLREYLNIVSRVSHAVKGYYTLWSTHALYLLILVRNHGALCYESL